MKGIPAIAEKSGDACTSVVWLLYNNATSQPLLAK